jgi:hypothetical protein
MKTTMTMTIEERDAILEALLLTEVNLESLVKEFKEENRVAMEKHHAENFAKVAKARELFFNAMFNIK